MESAIPDFLIPGDGLIDVTVYGYLLLIRGEVRLEAVTEVASETLREMGAIEREIRSLWTVPDADRMYDYRAGSLTHPSDPDGSLRDSLSLHHLKELDLPAGCPALTLRFDPRNRLTRETLAALKRFPGDLYVVLSRRYLADSCLIP